jgi:phosphoribosylanthranilate isomerase
VIVQIYSLTTPADVEACAAAGVDHIGVAAGGQDVPAAVSTERARKLFELWPNDPSTRTAALSVHTDPEAVLEYGGALAPDILHVCSDTYALSPEATESIRRRLPPGTDLMKSIEVTGPESVAAAQDFAAVSDWLLLDTATSEVQGVGASGRTHDWSVSRRIVEAVEVPVILAGGLGPDNVIEAIETVRPAGVDSYTHTSVSERKKDPEKLRAFVEHAQAAAEG